MPEETLLEVEKADPTRREIIHRYKYAQAHYAPWNDEAAEDYEFALGEQWTDEDRQTLKDESRPCLTFNRIKPLINIISGYERENSARIKVNPEGGEDRIFSEVMDRIIKAIDKWSHLSFKTGYWFDDGSYCGKGFLEAIISYDKDPIKGEIQFKLRSPYQILPDPDSKEYDLNEDARYCFKIVRLTKAELLELYPKKKSIIKNIVKDSDTIEDSLDWGGIMKEGSDDDYGNRPNVTTVVREEQDTAESELEEDEKFTVKEYWKPKSISKFFVISLEDGGPERFDTKEQAEGFVSLQAFGKVIERKVKEMWVYAMCAGVMLQEEKSPFEPYYTGYPFFRFLADWAPNAKTEILRTQGLTRSLKDPQKEKNKAKSQYLHILNTQANSGWIGDEDALTTEGWKELENMGSKPGLTIKKKKGSELTEIQAKLPAAGHIQREQSADEEFKQISNINPDLLGMQEKTASGRAISLRIRQAILAFARLFFNYRYSKEILGKFMLEMVPLVFDAKKAMKVIGPEYMKKAVDPQKYPEGLTEGHIQAFLTMVKDHRYDVYVTEADQNATIRFEIFQELTELMKAGAPIPIDLIIDYLDLPNSEEVKQRIKEQQQMMQQQQLAAMAAKGKPAA